MRLTSTRAILVGRIALDESFVVLRRNGDATPLCTRTSSAFPSRGAVSKCFSETSASATAVSRFATFGELCVLRIGSV